MWLLAQIFFFRVVLLSGNRGAKRIINYAFLIFMPALRFMKRWLKSRWYKSLPPIFPPIISCCSPWCNAKRSFVQNRRHEHKFMYWMKLKIFTLQHYRITKHYIKLKNKKTSQKKTYYYHVPLGLFVVFIAGNCAEIVSTESRA